MEHLPEIVAVPDVDVIFIGPVDLSHSLGLPGQLQHPVVQSTIEQIADVVTRSKVKLGIMVGSAAAAREWGGGGAHYIAIPLDSVVSLATQAYLGKARK